MTTRNTAKTANTKTKTTRTARAAAKAVEPEVLEPMTWSERTAQRIIEVYRELTSFDGLVSPRRLLVATVIGLLAGASVGYWGSTLITWLMAGALILTGSAFIAFLAGMLGAFATIFSGVTTYFKVQHFCLSINVDSVSKLFRREPKEQAA